MHHVRIETTKKETTVKIENVIGLRAFSEINPGISDQLILSPDKTWGRIINFGSTFIRQNIEALNKYGLFIKFLVQNRSIKFGNNIDSHQLNKVQILESSSKDYNFAVPNNLQPVTCVIITEPIDQNQIQISMLQNQLKLCFPTEDIALLWEKLSAFIGIDEYGNIQLFDLITPGTEFINNSLEEA